LIDDEFVVVWRGQHATFPRPDLLALAGDHGARNALAAIAACVAYGVPVDAIATGLTSFQGVENRLEVVRSLDGVTWVNDTSATAPAAAVAGLRVLAPRAKSLHIIAGGADKKTNLEPFADELAAHHAKVYLLDGTATVDLAALLEVREVNVSGPFPSMQDAVTAIETVVETGDVVALCPGCASFGMFRNEFDRGAQFRQAVAGLNSRSALQEVQS
jgi:UDP-N-acetylmuramoylalanine--D-glutamate ligase